MFYLLLIILSIFLYSSLVKRTLTSVYLEEKVHLSILKKVYPKCLQCLVFKIP